MIRTFLFLALSALVLALGGPDSYGLWAWWGFAACLIGATLSIGPWALGKVAKLRVLEHYNKIEPQLSKVSEKVGVVAVFVPMLRVVSAALGALAFGTWLIRKHRLLQALVVAFVALIAVCGPLIWRAAG